MKRLDVCEVLGKEYAWLRTNSISAAKIKVGVQVDFSKKLVEHKNGGRAYLLKEEVRQYYNRLTFKDKEK